MDLYLVAAAAWLACFALCLYVERRNLTLVKRCQGRTMATLFVLTALLTAPILLCQVTVDHLLSRSFETKKL